MPANNQPIFPLTPKLGNPGVLLSTAMTAGKRLDGTDALATTAFQVLLTAGADGDRLDSIKVKYSGVAGAAPSGSTATTVLRVFANNGSANTTAGNNILLADWTIPGISYAAIDTVAIPEITVPIQASVPANWRILVGLTVAPGGTNCALAVSANAGAY